MWKSGSVKMWTSFFGFSKGTYIITATSQSKGTYTITTPTSQSKGTYTITTSQSKGTYSITATSRSMLKIWI